MRRVLLPIAAALLLALALPGLAGAQDSGPRVTAELSADSTVLGQPVMLRIKILFPTWMPVPAVFPEIEQPALLVRLPERATLPTRERVGGESWPGITRLYRLYPLAPGRFDIPTQTVTVTYADPDTLDPVTRQLPIGPFTLTATMPEAARALDPPILATALIAEQQIEMPEEPHPGDAIRRRVSARIEGTTALLIPPLIPPSIPPQDRARPEATLRAYPDEPSLSETETRGILSGTRDETVTYVIQSGGTATLPDIALSWFNTETGRIETLTLEGITLDIPDTAPPAAGSGGVLRAALTLLGVVGALWLATTRLWPRLDPLWARARLRWRASEPYAHRRVMQALAARRLDLLLPALEVWAAFHPAPDGRVPDPLRDILLDLGRARFAAPPTAGAGVSWDAARATYRRLRRQRNVSGRAARSRPPLPALNPY
jgi:hypothetical protein